MKTTVFLIITLSILTAGCSKRAWYDGLQTGHNYECGKLEGEAKEKCLKQSNMSYDQYNEIKK
ncbi:hypothetical protein [Seleniivibrio sp.]|uniref:hypothetical protein n=1 Tax=Seleniivibrio sp. TaxID=2898801 RepID=UPI0025D78D21|nr:hypothetical protein [Seleniivibrio sp.]MCD8554643.1 hypothetical protein [Seleniivibrio sp.]